MLQRIAIGTILVIAAFVAIFFSTWPAFMPFFALGFSFITALVLWEFYRLASFKGHKPLTMLGMATGFAYALSVFTATQAPPFCFLPYLIVILSLLFAFYLFLLKGENPFVNLSITFFGILYLAVPLSCILLITYYFPANADGDGRWWVVYAIFVSKLYDTGAYFGGKMIGKKPLAPYVSPNKTVEGAFCGLLLALASSVSLPFIAAAVSGSGALDLGVVSSLIFGLIIALLAQLGDLSESLLKRDAKVKDSSQLPGLGGLLDIIDSLVFTLPLVYGYVRMLPI